MHLVLAVMVPRARIAVQQRAGFDKLLAVLASFALVRVVCIACRLFFEREKRAQIFT